jgi:hypothetical protein
MSDLSALRRRLSDWQPRSRRTRLDEGQTLERRWPMPRRPRSAFERGFRSALYHRRSRKGSQFARFLYDTWTTYQDDRYARRLQEPPAPKQPPAAKPGTLSYARDTRWHSACWLRGWKRGQRLLGRRCVRSCSVRRTQLALVKICLAACATSLMAVATLSLRRG